MDYRFLDSTYAPYLAELHASVDVPWETPWSLKSYEELLFAPSVRCLGVIENAQLISFILYQDDGEGIDILYLATHASFRKRGLATSLVQHIMALKHVKQIFLDVCTANKVALSFYEKLEFSPINTRKNYYKKDDTYFDAIVFNYVKDSL